MDRNFNDDKSEHKSDDLVDDDLVLHASVSGGLLDKRNTTLKKKPLNTQLPNDEIENDLVTEKESKVKPKLKDKSKGNKKKRGEVLTMEAALDFMIKERQDFDFECAALRAENDQLKQGLEKYSHLSPSKASTQPPPEPEVVEKIVIKKILDPNGKKYKQDAEQLSLENEKLKQQHLEMEALLEQQRQLAEEAQQHPISQRKSVANGSVPETNHSTTVHHRQQPAPVEQPHPKPVMKKPKSEKKIKKSQKQDMIQKSLQPVSASNCNTFPMLLWKGAILWKIPYNGRGVPERRLVMIKRAPLPGKKAKAVHLLGTTAESGTTTTRTSNKKQSTPNTAADTYIVNPPTIIWANPDKASDLKNARELVLYEGAHIVLGHQSPAFWKSKSRGTPLPPEQFCFSIITNSRSLDLAAESIEEVIAWKNALHMLLVMMSPNQAWAIDNLVQRQPIWHHEELENHATQKMKKKKKEEVVVTIGESHARDRDDDDHDHYQEASQAAKQASLKDQMFAAARAADYKRLENILKTQISVNLMEHGQESDTILMIACRAGLDKIAKLCLDFGGRNDPHPDFGQTALHCAVESRSYKCARVLLEVAAASQADSIIANLRDSGDQSPLHISATFGDTKMSTILVSHGAEIDSVDSKKRAPLHLCAGSGHKICLSLLLDNGGDMCIDMGDGQGNTPLHYSAEQGHLTCCRLLLETAANPLARNIHQQTPYNVASLRGHQKICLLLLDYQDSVARGSGGGSYLTSPPRAGPQRSSSLNHAPSSSSSSSLFSPFPQQLERHVSVPGSSTGGGAGSASPLFYKQPTQPQPQAMFSPSGAHPHNHTTQAGFGMDQNLPRPHSARVNSGSSGSSGSGGSPLSPQFQQPNTSRDRTHTSHSMMPDMASPMMNHPHTARDRSSSTSLFEGLAVNSGYLPQQQQPTPVQTNLQKNFFQNSKVITSMEHVPQSPVATPTRKMLRQRSPSPAPKRDFYNESTEVDYTTPSEEFELFETVWHVYWTEEGYAYYLDTLTQHSQWDDPRTHGLLQYDEITGELLVDNMSASVLESAGSSDFQQNYEANEEIQLALQQQDSFLQPKAPPTPNRDLSPQKRPATKRVQSMKPQKILANTADMSPYKTDTNTSDDSDGDNDRSRFSVPARGSRVSQLKSNGITRKKAFGTPEKSSSSENEEEDDEDSDDSEGRIPRLTSRMRHDHRKQPQQQDGGMSDEDAEEDINDELSGSSQGDSGASASARHKPRATVHRHRQEGNAKDKGEEPSHSHPIFRKKTAPKGPRNIPYLSEEDMASWRDRSKELEVRDTELEEVGGSGTWFNSGGSDHHKSEDELEDEVEEDDLALSETVSRMVQPPHGLKPIKTNCFSPDKASLARAEHLQRTLSSPTSSSSSAEEEQRRHNKGGLDTLHCLADSNNQVLVGTMQLESDNDDDDDDFFDTIITMKKDELASTSAESNVNNDNDNDNDNDDHCTNVNADYLKFLSKVEKEVDSSPQNNDEDLSLAVVVDTSDWDEDMEKREQLQEQASAEKIKQMRIFDTSRDGGYGNGGHTLARFDDEEDAAAENKDKKQDKKQDKNEASSKQSPQRKKLSHLHVETEFVPDGSHSDNLGDVKPLQPGGESPSVHTEDKSSSSASLEVRVQPYLQFLEAGNSVRQVRRQMEKDNQSKDLIKLMMERSDDIQCMSSASSTRPASLRADTTDAVPSKATPEELSVLKQDPVIGKYIKMAAMGVPFGNVEHKMKTEGIEEGDMHRVAQALGQAPPPSLTASLPLSSTSGSVSSTIGTESRPTSSRRSSSVSLVKMHWNTLPLEKLENSIWATKGDEEGDSMEEKEMQELEKLFAASGNTMTTGNASSQEGKGTGGDSANNTAAAGAVVDPRLQLLVLEGRRAQNIVIGLSQFKGQKSHKELLAAVCRLDDLNGSLNIDKLQNLMPLLPTLHEAKKMRAAHTSQHPAEVFFNTAVVFYPDLLKRLQCFITCLTFADTSTVLLRKMKHIVDACNEVISSDSLARILQKMLTVGNLMNEGTYRGQASGFTLDSLLKMVHTKGVDKKTSVLDYVIKSLLERGEDRLLSLSETLEVGEETTRLSGRDCSREIDHLFAEFKVLEEEFSKASKQQIESIAVQEFTEDFTEKLRDFLDYATETIQEMTKMHELMKRKIVVVVEYFGEDVATCETTKIFSVIRQFIVAFESSKKALIARRNRKLRK